MRNLQMILRGLIIVLAVCASAWAQDNKAKQAKTYPDPHDLHLTLMRLRAADFSPAEIVNWPEFTRSLQAKLSSPGCQTLFDHEARLLISGIKPDRVSDDTKTAIIEELNKFLADELFMSRLAASVVFSQDTRAREMNYKRSRSPADLRWLNRNILSDIFPQIPRNQRKGAELTEITCSTCHVEEVEPYGPLKNFIQRSNVEGLNAYLVAVHPEAPYTFKPLLKRLVCVECHGKEKKVDKVVGSAGETKAIPLFYGAGSETTTTTVRPNGKNRPNAPGTE
jgi:hypothetical protein